MRGGSERPIGGYFSWEFPMSKRGFPHEQGCLVNSGHGALQLLLQSIGNVSKVYIPYYTCDVVPFALDRVGIKYEFYHINERLEITNPLEIGCNEYIVYTNYFGIKDTYLQECRERYGSHLIIDNAQALFAPEISACHQIYSPRKFIGVPDGGILVSPRKIDVESLTKSVRSGCCMHLLKRAEGVVSEGYQDFKSSDHSLCELPLQRMSDITLSIMQSLDYSAIVKKRKSNFAYLHSRLGRTNALSSILGGCVCPLVYPYYTKDGDTLRQELIDNKVFVARYWPNVTQWCKPVDIEYTLCNNILPLPIDQRYDETDMERIIKLINR